MLMSLLEESEQRWERVGGLERQINKMDRERPTTAAVDVIQRRLLATIRAKDDLEVALQEKADALSSAAIETASAVEAMRAAVAERDAVNAAREAESAAGELAAAALEGRVQQLEDALAFQEAERLKMKGLVAAQDAETAELRGQLEGFRATIDRAGAEAVHEYKASAAFRIDVVEVLREELMRSLGRALDQVLLVRPDFPVSEVDLFRAFRSRQSAEARTGAAVVAPEAAERVPKGFPAEAGARTRAATGEPVVVGKVPEVPAEVFEGAPMAAVEGATRDPPL